MPKAKAKAREKIEAFWLQDESLTILLIAAHQNDSELLSGPGDHHFVAVAAPGCLIKSPTRH